MTTENTTDKLSEEQRKVITALRHAGFAVIVWTPGELKGANPRRVEDRSIELGHDVISDLAPTYKITRFYADDRENRVIKTGLTEDEAKEHCRDPETSSKTATNPDEPGDWFEGLNKE